MPSTYPAPGDHIGRFRVLSQLGAGGMGVVYEALEENLDRPVALKVISPQFADDPDFRARFTSEARALASLDSPHVVQVYAHGEEDGYLYIATQLIPDGDLGQMLRQWGPAPVGKAAGLIEQVASGLADAHAAGLVHRDIKPGNVLVRRRGPDLYGYLGDFGIARRVDAEVTRVGGPAIGTPSYMAPELHSGATAGIATDIYSLGCLLWVTLTGTPPYPGGSEYEIVGGHVTKPVPQVAGGSPLVLAVNRVLALAMAKDPAQRYATAAALRDDLHRAALLSDDPAFMTAAQHSGSTETRVPTSGPQSTPTPMPISMPTPTPTPAPRSIPAPGYQPQWSQPPQTVAPATTSKGLLYTVIGLGVAVVAVGAVVAVLLTSGGGTDTTADPVDPVTTSTTTSTTTASPTSTPPTPVVTDTSAPTFAELPADEIVTTAQRDMKIPDSLHFNGSVTTDGQPITFDLVLTTDGNCDGTLGLDGGSSLLRRIDGATWIKPDGDFWRSQAPSPDVAQLVIDSIGDDWVSVTGAEADEFSTVCDLDTLFDTGSSLDSYQVVGTGSVQGHDVVKVDDTSAKGTATLYIDAEDPHYLLKSVGPPELGSYTLTDFNVAFTAQAPPSDQVTSFPN